MQPLSRVRTIEEILEQALAPRRFNTWIVGLFALTALVLAAVGIYGVMSFAVATRTRELGVRAALGAGPGELMRLVLGQGLLLTAVAMRHRPRRGVPADAVHGVDALQRGAARSAHVRAGRRRVEPGGDGRHADARPGAR